jgi:hypothetical protein
MSTFQSRIDVWLVECFGQLIASDKMERNHRFLEEALETVQANGCSKIEALQLVDYVYGRPVGELHQEIGGAMVTLAALAYASGMDVMSEGHREAARIEEPEIMAKIRAKQAVKPKFSPLAAAPDSYTNMLEQEVLKLRGQLARLEATIDTPHTGEWVESTKMEAAHQIHRWSASHDAGKEPSDWFWLIGYLGGKALQHFLAGNPEKGKHHIISTSAALLNWYRHVTGDANDFRPGIADPDLVKSIEAPKGMSWKGPWDPKLAGKYMVGDNVEHDSVSYVCKVNRGYGIPGRNLLTWQSIGCFGSRGPQGDTPIAGIDEQDKLHRFDSWAGHWDATLLYQVGTAVILDPNSWAVYSPSDYAEHTLGDIVGSPIGVDPKQSPLWIKLVKLVQPSVTDDPIMWRGDYELETQYEKDDAVWYEKRGWRCIWPAGFSRGFVPGYAPGHWEALPAVATHD